MKSVYDLKLNDFGYHTSPRIIKDKRELASGSNFWFYLRVAGQVGYAVAGPLVLGAIGGKLVDERLTSYPRWTMIGIFSGFFASVVTFSKIVKEIIDKKD